jgi:hypothetical protein
MVHSSPSRLFPRLEEEEKVIVEGYMAGEKLLGNKLFDLNV